MLYLSYHFYFRMLIRKNTKAFKTILEIFTTCMDRPDRENLIRLFITKAGNTVHDRISIEGIEGNASLFYEMNYQAVLNSLRSSNHQLHESDDVPGLYFFHSTSNKSWDETPFEFDEAVKKEFASLPDLPIVRKKEKVQKTALPVAKPGSVTKATAKSAAKKDGKAAKSQKADLRRPEQPDYGLKREIDFDFLDKVIFRHSRLSKKDVLDYYDKISEHLLPYLKDRPLAVRLHSDLARTKLFSTLESLSNGSIELPGWINKVKQEGQNGDEHFIICNDREHLLFFVNIGCVEFHTALSRSRSLEMPDYMILAFESPGEGIAEAAENAARAKEIFDALGLPAFVKSDGTSALHVYIPLDGKSKYQSSVEAAEYLAKLIQVKTRGAVSLKGSDDTTYGKVAVDYLINGGALGVIAPYSLVQGESAIVSSPLSWDEIEDNRLEEFNHETIFARLKEGDPMQNLGRKKVSADELLSRLTENYSFLFS